MQQRVLVTGGAGYVGAVLVPKLLDAGYRVRVLDLYIYSQMCFAGMRGHPGFDEIKGDLRDPDLLRNVLPGCDSVIHLACISSDLDSALDPAVSRSIDLEGFGPFVRIAKASGVGRFVYASTCGVYGSSDAEKVTEDHPLLPVDDHSRYKGMCEPVLLEEVSASFTGVVVRPATVFGYSPRQRLDLIVNLLTNHAVNCRRIAVRGGAQTRPSIHIEDLASLYVQLLETQRERIDGRIFNAGHRNASVGEIAESVKKTVEELIPEGGPIELATRPSDDERSYRICSERIERELGWVAPRSIEDGVRDLVRAFRAGLLPDSLTDSRYFNTRRMQEIRLQ